MANLSNVALQRAGQTNKAHFVYNKDNNTSFQFGEIQPILFHRAQTGDETHKFQVTQICRMLDLACATFGRCDLKTSLHFVSYEDIFPNWKNVLSAVPDTFFDGHDGFSNIPLKFPTIGIDFLSMLLLTKDFASICVYYRPVGEGGRFAFYDRQSYDIQIIVNCFPNFNFNTSNPPFTSADFRNYYYLTARYLSPEGSDFVFKTTDGTNDFIVCAKLNDRGRRLYKVLTGLEYTFDCQDNSQVDMLAMIAYFYAYFCAYSLPRYENWLETNAYKLVKYVQTYGSLTIYSDVYDFPLPDDFLPLFRSFLHDLSECWYTENADYVSCTYSPLDNNPSVDAQNLSDLRYVRGGDEANASGIFNTLSPEIPIPSVNGFVIDSTNLDQVSDDILKKLYLSVSKDSAIGFDIKKRLIAKGFHTFVDEAESHFIYSNSMPIKITDVNSNTDNYDPSTGTGKPLGAYTGKGVSADASGNVTFTNKEPGYYIMLATVVPRSKVVNALNPAHKCNNRYTHYNPDYDAVGFEVISRQMVGKLRNVWYPKDQSQSNKQTFGLQPRYTGIKTSTSSTLNGLFSLRSEREQWLPYTLDQVIIENNGAHSFDFDPSEGKFGWQDADDSEIIPVAGKTWRIPCDQPWKGNFNRIFMLTTPIEPFWDETENTYPDPPTDHFLCNFEIMHDSYSFMLPTDESWQTIDEDKGAPMMNVRN